MKTTFRTMLLATMVLPLCGADKGDLPPAAKQLKGQYEHAIRSAVDPITAKYCKSLQELCTRLTKQGDLDSAIAVKRLLDDTRIRAFVGSWSFPHGRFEITRNRAAVYLDKGTKGKCEIQGDELVILWENDWQYRFKLEQTGDKTRMKEVAPDKTALMFEVSRED